MLIGMFYEGFQDRTYLFKNLVMSPFEDITNQKREEKSKHGYSFEDKKVKLKYYDLIFILNRVVAR